MLLLRMLGTQGSLYVANSMPHTVDKQSSLVNVVHLKVITFLGGVENAKKNIF